MGGHIVAALVVFFGVWGALANIMPSAFQITREKHAQMMSVVFGPKTIWIAVIGVAVLLGWYIWNLEGRLSVLATATRPTVVGNESNDPGLIIAGWGADESSCKAELDVSKVPEQIKKSFDVALVCGFADPQTDLMKDTRITVSHLFTIQNPLTIAAQFSQNMADSMAKDQDNTVQKLRATIPRNKPLPRDAAVQLTNLIWLKPVLLPKGFDTNNIHKLDDVIPSGGKLSDKMGEVNIARAVPLK